MLQAGAKVGRYEVRELIGAGGMGQVYRARDTNLDRDVALKVLVGESLEVDRIRRFQQEARSASSLCHPCIIHVYDAGECDADGFRIHYIAMELIEGASLRELIDQSVDLRRILEALAQVAEALERAHQAGILHRDLKPENIMVTQDGYAKVVDFGLAKLFESAQTKVKDDSPTALLTPSGVIAGTPAYMSPEQIQGLPLDSRSDIFSLGVILHEVVSGKRPFAGTSPVDLMHSIVHDDPPALADRQLDSIARKCLAKAVGDRYAAASDVAAEIRDHLSGLRTDRQQERPGSKRRLGLVALAVLVFVVATALLTSVGIFDERETSELWSDRSGEEREDNLLALAEPRFENGNRVYVGEVLRIAIRGADLEDFLLMLSQYTGVDFLLDPGVSGSVTIQSENTPWDAIFERVLEQNGLTYRIDGTVVIISRPPEPAEER